MQDFNHTNHRLYDEFKQLLNDDEAFANMYDDTSEDFHTWVLDYEQDTDWQDNGEYTDWSIRAGVFLENVMDTLQQAEEMDGLEGMEYVRALNFIGDVCKGRAMNCLKRLNEEGEA